MSGKTVVHGVLIETSVEFGTRELCRACAVREDWLIALVAEGVIEPHGRSPAAWRFSGESLRRARIVRRLQRDLDLNLAGAALALELIEENERLRRRLAARSAPGEEHPDEHAAS